MTTKIIMSEQPFIEQKNFDYAISEEMDMLGVETLNILEYAQEGNKIPVEAKHSRRTDKRPGMVVHHWEWWEITIK